MSTIAQFEVFFVLNEKKNDLQFFQLQHFDLDETNLKNGIELTSPMKYLCSQSQVASLE